MKFEIYQDKPIEETVYFAVKENDGEITLTAQLKGSSLKWNLLTILTHGKVFRHSQVGCGLGLQLERGGKLIINN